MLSLYSLFRLRTCRSFVPRSVRKRWILVVCCVILFVLILFFVFHYGLLCVGWQATAAINELCRLYKAGKVAGNMCLDLCVTEVIVLGSCHTYHLSKDVVIAAKWQNEPVILKTQLATIFQYDRLATEDDTSFYPSTADFAHMVKTMLRFNFNVSMGRSLQSDTALLTYLWSLNFQEANKTPQAYCAAIDSIWSLVQQNEYILFKYFEKYNVFPKVVGTCGHVYAVEYVKTQTYQMDDWSSKLVYALKMLQLVTLFQTAFHQPLYLCDVKPEHFGLTATSDMKVIDADTTFFKSVINKMVQNSQPCTTHDECAFWDCKSKCHPTKKTCNSIVLNNNLQMVCENIFLRETGAQRMGLSQPGLLQSHHTASSPILRNLLLECANPSEETDPDLRAEASDAVFDRLRLFLINELRNQNTAEDY